jgi:hypothetical protein
VHSRTNLDDIDPNLQNNDLRSKLRHTPGVFEILKGKNLTPGCVLSFQNHARLRFEVSPVQYGVAKRSIAQQPHAQLLEEYKRPDAM